MDGHDGAYCITNCTFITPVGHVGLLRGAWPQRDGNAVALREPRHLCAQAAQGHEARLDEDGALGRGAHRIRRQLRVAGRCHKLQRPPHFHLRLLRPVNRPFAPL